MGKITEVLTVYLKAQINAGAEAVQVFDSWVGCLGPDEYKDFVLPYTKKLIDSVKGTVPVINFSTNTGTYLNLVKEAGGDVIGVDWKVRLNEAWDVIGPGFAIQGNLDPVTLFGPVDYIRKRAKEILEAAGGRPGHIFNLGHGIIVGTPIDHVKALVDFVHEFNHKG
jgi:uroporphyrinogen decarboxylase